MVACSLIIPNVCLEKCLVMLCDLLKLSLSYAFFEN